MMGRLYSDHVQGTGYTIVKMGSGLHGAWCGRLVLDGGRALERGTGGRTQGMGAGQGAGAGNLAGGLATGGNGRGAVMLTRIDENTVEYGGVRYYRTPFGYYRGRLRGKNLRLHRSIWESYFGVIPDGYVVHHIDEDKDNNNIENLMLMDDVEHRRFHWTGAKSSERKRRFVAGGTAWMRTSEGRRMASECSKKNRAKDVYKTFVCLECGQEFQAKSPSGARYCGTACRSAAYRNRKKAA